MTNREAENLISRNKSVFKYDPEMTKALSRAIKALDILSTVTEGKFHDMSDSPMIDYRRAGMMLLRQ